MSKNATVSTHFSLLAYVMGLISAAGEFFRRDVRAGLNLKYRNPSITLSVLQNDGEKLPSQNGGIALLRSGPSKHFRWIVDVFQLVPALSDDPVLDYLNGHQQVDENGVLAGHAHLHLYLAEDVQQVNDWMAGKEGAVRPASYRFFGGHAWYRTEKIGAGPDAGKFLLRANSFVGPNALTPGKLYLMQIDFVHVDDTRVTAAVHGMDSASLVTPFMVLE